MENSAITGFSGPLKLFPLDRGGGFTCDVVADAVDALDLIDDAGGDDAKQATKPTKRAKTLTFFLIFSFPKFSSHLSGCRKPHGSGYEVKHNADAIARGAPLVFSLPLFLSFCLSFAVHCGRKEALIIPQAKIVLAGEIDKFRGYVVWIRCLCPPVSVAMDSQVNHPVAIPGRQPVGLCSLV